MPRKLGLPVVGLNSNSIRVSIGSYEVRRGLTAEYPSTPKEILKSVATRLRGYAVAA